MSHDQDSEQQRHQMLSQAGRVGAYRQQATHDTRETTAAARQAFADRFTREVDPDGTLPPQERARRAEAARKAYYAALSLKGAQARWRKGMSTQQQTEGEA